MSSKLVDAVNYMGNCQDETKFHMKAHGRKEIKIYSNKFGHMTKMAAITIYGKNPSKILFSGTNRLIAMKLGM